MSGKKSLLLLSITLLAAGCEKTIKDYYDTIYTQEIYANAAYDLSTPDTTFSLTPKLQEISGLSYIGEDRIAAIQDEKGRIYILDATNGSLVHEVKFGKKGDYEGVEVVGEMAYAIRSNGKLYRFLLDFESEEVESEVVETPLSAINDVEGLSYDAGKNQLLIACKAVGKVGGNEAKGKCVYSYNLDNDQFDDQPVFNIRKRDISKMLKEDYPNLKLKNTFNPSGLAIHPLTGKVHVLAHDGKAIIIVDEAGNIEKYYPLNPLIFRQPEGICFNENGDMFIANEAAGAKANLMKFSYRQ